MGAIGIFCRELRGRLKLLPKLKISGAVPPVSHMPSSNACIPSFSLYKTILIRYWWNFLKWYQNKQGWCTYWVQGPINVFLSVSAFSFISYMLISF